MCEKRTAVVVDDEPITCMDVAEMLREMGFDVVGEAADGSAGYTGQIWC